MAGAEKRCNVGPLQGCMTKKIKNAAWLGYVAYAIALTIGLLYGRFPSDVVKAYLVSQAAEAHPPMVLSLERVRPGWPPGIDLVGVGISLREAPQQDLLQADRISIVPALWSLASGEPRYHIDAHAYDGDIVGHVCLQKKGTKAPLSTSLKFEGLHVGLHSYIRSLLGRDVSGVLNGDIDYAGPQQRLMEGEGQGTIEIANGKVKLLQPILGLSAIDFDRLSVAMSLKDRKLSLTRVELQGQTIKGELSGVVTLNADLSRSRLDLKGTVEPLGGLVENMSPDAAAALRFLRQGLKKLGRSFVIQGSLGKPIFRFL